MKKLLTLILMIISLSCIFLGVGCGEEPSYKVTLDANGGSINVQEFEFKIGDDYTLPTPTKEGYTFDCWMFGESKFTSSGNWSVKDDVTLIAKYKPNKYTVSLVDILNNPISSQEVYFEKSYEIVIPDNVKHLFKGLKNSKTNENFAISGDSWQVKEDVTLIVEYKPTKITLNLNGGSAIFETEIFVNYGELFDLSLYVPKKEDFSFDYWEYNNSKYENGAWYELVESAEFTAVWKEAYNNYNVSIVDSLNNFLASTEVTYHKAYELPVPNNVKDMLIGYKNAKTGEYVALSGESWNIKEDTILIAEYKPTKITLNLNGGLATFETEITINYGEQIDLTSYIPTREDYSFMYWEYNGTKYEGGTWTTLNENVEFKAIWKEIIYKFNVSIVDVLNKPIASLEVTYNRSYTLPVPTEIKDMLIGYKNSKTGESVALSGDKWKIKENTVIVAEYKPTKITFNLNGGTSNYKEIIVNYGETLDLSPYAPTMEDYSFEYWEFDNAKYEGGIWTTLKESVEFKAIWKEIIYKFNVSIVDVLNKPIASLEVTYNRSYNLPVPTEIEDMLVGYKNSKTGESVAFSGDKWEIKEDTVLVAEYKPTKVTLNLNGGLATFETEITINYGEELDLTSYIPTKSGQPFSHWQFNGAKYESGVWTTLKESVEITTIYKSSSDRH